ncbi:lipopolysaccharide biosynthesis protein [Arthrobacter psychrolactophilus]|uniref:non-specific protein-tyrosine kinase n=1 Tax=Arthrobacter psychrolactophilus TaxID=92442 RepID=A0A2V5ITQ5_9MICC|nr:polysaccharide biosynthesis tyrosine autokinase [Arthrobacter psychrolactophilus]PYI38752.1 lipopolysaccharide biosynthesis protein [Arthrobacter psychrolactophilus]
MVLEDEQQGTTDKSLDVRDYVRVFRQHWLGVVALVLIGILCSAGWILLQKPSYSANSIGYVSIPGGDNMGSALAGDNLAKSKATSYASFASSRPVAESVITSLKLGTTPDQLLQQISVSSAKDTPEIKISAAAGTPQEAQALANAWVIALAEQVKVLESTSAAVDGSIPAAESIIKIVPLGDAPLPTSPTSPNKKMALILGALAGMVLGVAYALVRNHLDRRIRSVEMVEKAIGTAVVGTIPVDERLRNGQHVVENGVIDHASTEGYALSEALRELRTNLHYMNVDKPPRVIVITSSIPSEGKSTIAANLAVTIAATGQKVVLIDGDLRRPVVSDYFGLASGGGLTDILSGQATLDDVLQVYGPVPSLAVLGAGRIPPNPSELLGSLAMKRLLDKMAEQAVILIDAPPLLPVTDAAILARSTDGALVVAGAGKTTIDELEKAVATLAKVNAPLLGAVLNRVPTTGGQAAGYGYYGKSYYYRQNSGKKAAKGRGAKQSAPAQAVSEASSALPDTYTGDALSAEQQFEQLIHPPKQEASRRMRQNR